MLPKKTKIILVGAVLSVSILAGCSKTERSILEAAQNVDLYSEYLSVKIENINERSSAILKVAFALQVKEWKGYPELSNINYQPLKFRSAVSKFSKDTIITLAKKSIDAKAFLLTESESVFIIQYLYSMLINDSSQIYVVLNKQQKTEIMSIANYMTKNVHSPDENKRLNVYKALAKQVIDWEGIKTITNDIPQMLELNERAKTIIEVRLLGQSLEKNLSTEKLTAFVEMNEKLFAKGNVEQSLLPTIAYSLVTKPFRDNYSKNSAHAISYLDYIILKKIPRLSETAITLKNFDF